MEKTILIDTVSLTATYDSDCPYPGTDYGDQIPVVISLDASFEVDKTRIIDTATIKIGDNCFCLSEIENWVELAKQAKLISEILLR